MNIVFMGTPEFSVPTLEMLHHDGHSVLAVFTQPDRARGRGKKLQPSPVKSKALEYGIPVYQPLSLRKGDEAAESLRILRELHPELIVVIAYGQILPKEILELPQYGCINLHASLLPRWRGAAPIQRAVMAGDAETGVTAMQMAEGLDTGDMLHSLRIPVEPDETADSLHDRLSQLSAQTLRETLAMLKAGKLHPVPQGGEGVCYAEKITKDMSRLDFSLPAAEIDRVIRGVTGFAVLNGRRVKLHGSVLTEQHSDAPAGTVIDAKTCTFVCGDGFCVRPTVMQGEGGKAMQAADFLRGFPVQAGDCFLTAE
ncbi:MAG: methionyl-tRNA formyltransferase [Oscillospiraceae bacterium]|nr:methionyl-tRNA formyltransferase [Oscillospiraceae bacterium]